MAKPVESKAGIAVRSSDTRIAVTAHAVEKVRERAEGEHNTRLAAMNDHDVRLELEDAWRSNEGEIWWELVDDEPIANTIVPLGYCELWGLVREDRRNPGHAVMVTVLPLVIIERNKNQRKWTRFKESLGVDHSLPNTQLAEKLKGYSLLEVSVGRAITPKPFTAVDPNIIPKPPAKARTADDVLVRWVDKEEDRCERVVPIDAVNDLVNRLVEDGVKEETIEFWQRRPGKIRRTVVVDF